MFLTLNFIQLFNIKFAQSCTTWILIKTNIVWTIKSIEISFVF